MADGTAGTVSATNAIDSTFACRTISNTQCWNEAFQDDANKYGKAETFGVNKNLHTTSYVCVIGKDGQCFENNSYTDVTWDGLKGRDSKGKCATKEATKCTSVADDNGTATAISDTLAADKSGSCRVITSGQCWNGSATTATSTSKFRNDKNRQCVDAKKWFLLG
jgi:hypothetical protein